MWGKLGYPRRALRLHEAAAGDRGPARRRWCRPSWTSCWRCPGSARTRPARWPSFAYGRRHPVVDTNVRRVVARAVLGQGDAGPPATARDLAAVAAAAAGRPGARGPLRRRRRWSSARWSARPGRRGAPPARWSRPAPGGPPAARRTTGPAKRPQRFAGTDRQVRGLLLDVLRAADGPVPRGRAGRGLVRRRPARPGPGRAGRRRPRRPAAGRNLRAARSSPLDRRADLQPRVVGVAALGEPVVAESAGPAWTAPHRGSGGPGSAPRRGRSRSPQRSSATARRSAPAPRPPGTPGSENESPA